MYTVRNTIVSSDPKTKSLGSFQTRIKITVNKINQRIKKENKTNKA